MTLGVPGSPPIPQYTQVFTAEKGTGRGFVPIMQGQVPGYYELKVEDLLSGTTITHDLKIVGLSVQ